MSRTFTRTVSIPQLDKDGKPLVVNNERVVARTLGEFTFKRPNFFEEKEIDMRIARDVMRLGGPPAVDSKLFANICTAAVLPYQVTKAPEGWDWDALTEEDAQALFAAYNQGLEEIAAKNA